MTMWRARLLAAMLVLPAPVLAEGQSEAVLDRLFSACDAAISNPSGMLKRDADVHAASTVDGNVLMRSTPSNDPGTEGGIMEIGVSKLPGGTEAICNISLFRPDSSAYADLFEVAGRHAEALIGPDTVNVGGPFGGAELGNAKGMQWASPDFPPAAQLRVFLTPQLANLTLIRHLPTE